MKLLSKLNVKELVYFGSTFGCEPMGTPVKSAEIEIVKKVNQEHEYMMLSRYQQDLDYYFGNGGRNEKHLYFDTFAEHIQSTKKLWDSLVIKPEWLTMEDIKRYEEMNNTTVVSK